MTDPKASNETERPILRLAPLAHISKSLMNQLQPLLSVPIFTCHPHERRPGASSAASLRRARFRCARQTRRWDTTGRRQRRRRRNEASPCA